MNQIALPYLGIFSENDPRHLSNTSFVPLEEGWVKIKKVFPKGPLIFLMLLIIGIINGIGLYKSSSSLPTTLGIIGILGAISVLMDMAIAIIGDGLSELEKHLFMANWMFDISTICTLHITLLYILNNINKMGRK
jgi:hypothetical protein